MKKIIITLVFFAAFVGNAYSAGEYTGDEKLDLDDVIVLLTFHQLTNVFGITNPTQAQMESVAAQLGPKTSYNICQFPSTDSDFTGDQNINLDDVIVLLAYHQLTNVFGISNPTQAQMESVAAQLGPESSYTISSFPAVSICGSSGPTITLSLSGTQMDENSTTGIDVIATASDTASSDITVPLTFEGTASSNEYSVTASSITIANGTTSGSITVTPIDDSVAEAQESVIINMGTPNGASQGSTTTVSIAINDDDGFGCSFDVSYTIEDEVFQFLQPPGTSTLPNVEQPTNLRFEGTTLTWDAPAGEAPDGYSVFKCEQSGQSFLHTAVVPTGTTLADADTTKSYAVWAYKNTTSTDSEGRCATISGTKRCYTAIPDAPVVN